jgi:tetratricopeptide (TPR) repeat protein
MEDKSVAEVPVETKKEDLYTRHIAGFVKSAEENLDQALEAFGFTVWHSLPPKEAAVLKERLGMRPLDATDYYNRGTAYGMEGKWTEAQADLRAALKTDADCAPAAFNLAVCLEKMDRVEEAREAYRQYLNILDRARSRRNRRAGSETEIVQEAARVHLHLETLGKS